MILPLLQQLIVLLIDFLGIWLLLLALLSNPKAKLNRIFSGMVFLGLLWVHFAYLARVPFYREQAFIFIKIAWFATPLFFFSLYCFSRELIGYHRKNTVPLITGVFLGTLSLIIVVTPNVLKGVHGEEGNFSLTYGTFAPYVLLCLFVMMLLTGIPVFSNILKSRMRNKQHIFFSVGLLFFFIANTVFNILLPVVLGITQYYFVGDYSTAILLLFTAYAVVRHDFFKEVDAIVLPLGVVAVFAVLLIAERIFFLQETSPGEIVFFWGRFLVFLILVVLFFRSVHFEREKHANLQTAYHELKELKELDRAKTEFVSLVSHQLRTPLSVVKSNISMMEEGDFGEFSNQAARAVQTVGRNVQRLGTVIEDTLLVASIEAGELALTKESGDIDVLLREVYDYFLPFAEEKGLDIQLSGKVVGDVVFDREKMRQVFYNLVENAVCYTLEGCITIEAGQKEKRNGTWWYVCVQDTGIGISPEYWDMLFRKFHRGDNAKRMRPDGSGVGLYVTKHVVEAHGGEVKVESVVKNKKKAGTILNIQVPY